jgi:N-methylhydantoinase B
MSDRVASTVTFEVIRNRLVAITEEMRIALQSVSGSPTVTEASDFFTGLFLPDGQVVSMGFQVAFQAPVCRALIQHINGQLPKYKPRDGDMYVGSDPYIGALHQNDVQMVGPIYAGDKIIAWAGVQAHQTDVGGMDFASWSPKAREVYQEGLRIPCVKLVDRGETREDVIDFIVNGSRLPNLLGLDIRAFIATLNVARSRIDDLVTRYGAALVGEVMERMIASSETRIRARLKELPDGEFHAADFLEHDGHENILYKIDVHLTKRGDHLKLDFSGSSKQAPGFINATRCGLVGGVCGSIMPTLAYDIQWNQGVMAPVEIIAPDGLLCTAQMPAPVGSATVEAIWIVANATTSVLNKLLTTSPRYRGRAQGINAGAMATFNLGGTNQFGEPFGLHLMDPIAAGGGAWTSKDGANAGGPITSPVSMIADVERNEQVAPLFYFYRRLARDTGGAGKYRGGLSAEVGLTLGGIKTAQALIMTHGAEVPNSTGLGGGWPGATVRQTMGHNAVRDYRAVGGDVTVFGPKPGLMPMTNDDMFAVVWQGGGGWGDPLERDLDTVAADVATGLVSTEAARTIYGAIIDGNRLDRDASLNEREQIRRRRVNGAFADDRSRFTEAKPVGAIGDTLLIVKDERGTHVASKAGYILSTGSTRWRAGAVAVTLDQPPSDYKIVLHDELNVTLFYCPATGTLLSVDFHRRDEAPVDDIVLDFASPGLLSDAARAA